MAGAGGNRDIVADAASGRRLLNGFAVLLIAAAIFLSFTFTAGRLLRWLADIWTKGGLPEARLWFFLNAAQLFLFAYMAAPVLLIVRFVEGRKIRTLGFRRAGRFRAYFAGAGVAVGMVGAVVLALALSGCVAMESPPNQPAGLAAAGPLAVFLLGYAVQGATEEVVSRGWILTSVSARHNRAWGVSLSTLFFVACHALNSGMNALAYLNLALFGVFTSLYVFRTNSLWGACGFHAAWNFALGNLFGLDVSGIAAEGGTLIDLHARGNVLLTGGAFGPEAGLPVTAALGLGILWFLATGKARQRAAR
jgi:membrane protease YdiL (CAAX protease family)